MDFELDPEQQALHDAVGLLLTRHAGTERARTVLNGPGYDHELETHLADAGFLDLPATDGAGPLEASIVVESIAAAHGTMAAGTRAMVLPAVGLASLPGPVALMDAGAASAPVRFAATAATLLVVDDEGVIACPVDGRARGIESPYCFPFGMVDEIPRGQHVDVDPQTVRAWWRVSLACEITGLLAAGLATTTKYVNERHQFGRPLGSFQAVQHKLAEAHVSVEATRWMVRWAAWHHADAELAAAAAAHAAAAAGSVVADLHQVSGAMGFTDEHDLALGTLRAVALRLELGGVRGHALEVARRRWGG